MVFVQCMLSITFNFLLFEFIFKILNRMPTLKIDVGFNSEKFD